MKTIKLKSLFKSLFVSIILALSLSCNSKSVNSDLALEKVEISEEYSSLENLSDEKMNIATPNTEQRLKIIKSANVKYKVGSVKKATRKIIGMVKEFDGYISDQRFQNTKYKIENRFTLKVPQKEFDRLLDSISSVADFVDYQNITSEDITEEYIDLKSRLKTKLEIKKRYEAILRNNTGSIKDILEAEEKIGNIQEEIEAVKGRLNYLTNKVSLSTIQVDLYEAVKYVEEPKSYSRTFLSKMKEGFRFGWNLIESMLLGLIYLWPLFIIGSVLTIIIRKKIRK